MFKNENHDAYTKINNYAVKPVQMEPVCNGIVL